MSVLDWFRRPAGPLPPVLTPQWPEPEPLSVEAILARLDAQRAVYAAARRREAAQARSRRRAARRATLRTRTPALVRRMDRDARRYDPTQGATP